MKRRVGLLYDSLNNNTGDKAMGIVFEQLFAADESIETVRINPLSGDVSGCNTVIVGGGQLLRHTGDTYYDVFRPRGNYILNAIGLLPPVDDLAYLNDYAFVSARTSAEVNILKKDVPATRQIPCMTTLLKGEPYTILGVKKGEPLIGVHLVPASLQMCPDIVEQINQLPGKKVLIPFTHYNHDRSFMQSLPFDDNCILLDELSPEQLYSVLGQMQFNIVSSLHATIFSYAQNVPFATLGQQKTIDYLADRKLDSFAYTSSKSLHDILTTLQTAPPDMKEAVQADKRELRAVLKTYKQIIHAADTVNTTPPAINRGADAQVIEQEVLQSVIAGRDRLIADMLASHQHLRDTIAQRDAQIAHKDQQLTEADNRCNALVASKEYKLGWHLAHPKGSARSLHKKSKSYFHEKALHKTPVRSLVDRYFISHPDEIQKTSDLAVVVHIYYPDRWPHIAKNIRHLDKAKISYDLHITLTEAEANFADTIRLDYPTAHIYTVPNRGRDILPFVNLARILLDNDYRYTLKLHTKKSLHWEGGDQWFDDSITELLPSKRAQLRQIVDTLTKENTGIIGPSQYYYPLKVNFAANGARLTKLLRRLYNARTVRRMTQRNRDQYGFFAGSMFWVRLDYLENLIDTAITSVYEPEYGQVDGTMAHAVERAFCIALEIDKRTLYELGSSGKLSPRDYASRTIPAWYTEEV